MIHKEFVQGDGTAICRVTFSLPSQVWVDAVYLVGDFNGWDRTSHPFQCGADGTCVLTLDLECGRTYQFRYLCDGDQWLNDNQADAYVPNPFGTSNCVLIADSAFMPYRDEEEKRRERDRSQR